VSADLLDSISLLCFHVPVTARTSQARPIYNSLTDYQQPDPRWISLCHRAPPKQRGALLYYGCILSSDIFSRTVCRPYLVWHDEHLPHTFKRHHQILDGSSTTCSNQKHNAQSCTTTEFYWKYNVRGFLVSCSEQDE
jgi:hypothetical protein